MKMTELGKTAHLVSIDELLTIVGEYGRFQKILNAMFCFMSIPCILHTMLMYFTADYPSWKCIETNASVCVFNGTFKSSDQRRCDMPLNEWEYTEPRDHSLLTYYNVDCKNEWLIELVTSIFFIGWICGAFVLGWCCDNIGRKAVLLVSIISVITVGFVSIFMPSLYLFIACRFVIGFFLPGTMTQMFIIMTEIVGSKYRAFAGLLVFEFGVVSTVILGLKAYFIRNWKYLHMVCTVPYIFLVVFFKFIPESVRYLRVKGRNEELIICFQKIADWNKTILPPNISIEPIPVGTSNNKSNPMELFRTKKLVIKSCIEIFGFFASGLLYYGVYLAANNLGGYKYRDYIIISVSELPVVFLSIYLCERYGRKKISMLSMLFACVALLALSFIPARGNLKIFRVVFGIFGKCFVGSNMDVMHTWATELYPTNVRGEAIGIFQAFLRVGAASAPWINQEFDKIYKSASFLFMAVVAIVSFALLWCLPETKITGMVDAENEKDIRNDIQMRSNSHNNDLPVSSFRNHGANCGD